MMIRMYKVNFPVNFCIPTLLFNLTLQLPALLLRQVALHSEAALEFYRTTVVKYPTLKHRKDLTSLKYLSNSLSLPNLMLTLLELTSLCMIPGTEIASLTTATVTPAATSTAILTRTTRKPIVKVTTQTQTESSRIRSSWQPKTPTTGSIHGLSSASAVLAQEWTAVLTAVVVFLGILVRDL